MKRLNYCTDCGDLSACKCKHTHWNLFKILNFSVHIQTLGVLTLKLLSTVSSLNFVHWSKFFDGEAGAKDITVPEMQHVPFYTNWAIACKTKILGPFYFFLKKFFVGHMSICGATDTPVLDFWWRLLWVSKPQWVLPYSNYVEAYMIYVPWDSPLVWHICRCIKPA